MRKDHRLPARGLDAAFRARPGRLRGADDRKRPRHLQHDRPGLRAGGPALPRRRLQRHPGRGLPPAREGRQTPVLVVDEAQRPRPEIPEELRLLTGYGMDSENRLCLLPVGPSEIRRRLAMGVCGSLAQRLVVRCHPGGLGRDGVEPYLAHRLGLAGAADVPVFTPNAVEALAQSARGMPRRVNRIAHYALCAAAAAGRRQVDAEHVQSAVEEMHP